MNSNLWKTWLNQPERIREQKIIVTARTALRAVPVLAGELERKFRKEEIGLEVLLPVLRAMTALWIAIEGNWIGGHLPQIFLGSATFPDAADNRCALSVGAAARYAAMLAFAEGASVVRRATDIAEMVDRVAPQSTAAADSDIRFLNDGEDFRALAKLPLWPGGVPAWAQSAWHELKLHLIGVDQDWDVWIDWYERSVKGAPLGLPLERVWLELTNEDWKRGPAFANGKLKEIIGRSRGEPESTLVPGEQFLPKPFPDVPQFEEGPRGEIVVSLDPPITGAGRTDKDQEENYDELRQKAFALRDLSPNRLGEIAKPAITFADCLSESFENTSINRIWSKGNVLRWQYDIHKNEALKPIDLRDPSLVLEPLCAASLDDLVKQLNIFLSGDARGRELDRVSLGPGQRDLYKKALDAITPAINGSITVSDNATFIFVNGDHNQVLKAPAGLHGDQAVDRVAKQEGNFLARILSRGYRIAVWVAEKAAGKFIADRVAEAWGMYCPAILQFIAKYSETIKQYLATLYNNPAVRAIVDFIAGVLSDS